MMRLARRASLLVALSLLTSTATAYAECAWVRWLHAPEGWSVMGGFSILESCDAAITTAVSRLPPLEGVRDKGFSSYMRGGQLEKNLCSPTPWTRADRRSERVLR